MVIFDHQFIVLRFDDAEAVLRKLAARGVIADYRAPDILRIAPIPLYNTFQELWRFSEILRDVISSG